MPCPARNHARALMSAQAISVTGYLTVTVQQEVLPAGLPSVFIETRLHDDNSTGSRFEHSQLHYLCIYRQTTDRSSACTRVHVTHTTTNNVQDGCIRRAEAALRHRMTNKSHKRAPRNFLSLSSTRISVPPHSTLYTHTTLRACPGRRCQWSLAVRISGPRSRCSDATDKSHVLAGAEAADPVGDEASIGHVS
jgi:hypothetical protein